MAILKEILENYVNKVSGRVDMKEEKELATRYIDSIKKELKRAN